MASRPGAQGRLRPEHRKRRGSSAVPARESRYGEQRRSCPCMRSAVSARRSRGNMSTPQKRPPTRHYLLTTSDNRRYGHAGRESDDIPTIQPDLDDMRVLIERQPGHGVGRQDVPKQFRTLSCQATIRVLARCLSDKRMISGNLAYPCCCEEGSCLTIGLRHRA